MLGVGVQPGPAAAQRVATRRRVILVVVAVGRAVAAAVVPGRHGHRNAERRRVGQGPVNGAAGLCRPGIFRTFQLMLTTIGVGAAWAASLIVSTNAWSGVGPEVHRLRRAGGHGDDHLDVEEHLSVGADRVRAGSVGRGRPLPRP